MFRSGFFTFLILPITLLLGACSVFGDRSGTEQVRYEVIATIGDNVEIRQYPARRAIASTMTSAKESNSAFRSLFRFISGNNADDQKISMTAPVQMQAATDTDGNMLFFMPSSLETIPQPDDPNLNIVTLEARNEAVLRYSGLRGWHSIDEKETALRKSLANTPWQPQGMAAGYFYDPPWTLPWARRNEVALEVTNMDNPN